MFTKIFSESADWGWLLNDENDEKAGKMSVHQMMGANGMNSKHQLYKSTLFDEKNKMISPTENKIMYHDNPKLLNGKPEINAPNTGVYKSSFHAKP